MDNKKVTYKEVKIGDDGYDKFWKNPLTKTYQYEYALLTVISELFQSTHCQSMALSTLELYFKELPDKTEDDKPKKTKEKIMQEIKNLVTKDVINNINFPMMNQCAVDIRVIPEKDGTHSFIFTDGIFGFKVKLGQFYKGHPGNILVKNLSM